MTYALVAMTNATYGGVYYTPNFTTSGAQPVWTKLTTVGLPSLEPDIFRVDYADPVHNQYLGFGVSGLDNGGTLYARTGGDWSLIMDTTIAAAVTGVTIHKISWLWTDPTLDNSVFCYAARINNILDADNYVLKSVDNGASWSVLGVPYNDQKIVTNLNVIGNYIWGGFGTGLLASASALGSMDGGATWDKNAIAAGLGWPSMTIDNKEPNYAYAHIGGAGLTFLELTGPPSFVDKTIRGGGDPSTRPDYIYTDPNNAGYLVYCDNGDIHYSEDYLVTDVLVNLDTPLIQIKAITGFWNENTADLVFGTGEAAEASGVRVYHIDSKTDTTVSDRSGANSTTPPYINSIPQVGGYIINYGIWAGMPPADKGIYLFSVEEGDITNIPDADNLGLPLFGDRSSWRDYDADTDGDGTELSRYHAQDIRDDMPQRHNPWPAPAGTAPVSDGSKYIATDILTGAEFDYSFFLNCGTPHKEVTLDSDAETVLDIQGACKQEIGLDVQQPTHVFIGPSFMPPDEPTFRPMYIEELANVTTTAPVLDGEVLTYDGATGEWVNEDPSATRFRTVMTLTAGTYNLDDTYDVVVLDATAGDITINLPSTASNDGLEYAFKRIDDTENTVAIMGSVSGLLDSDGEILTDSDGEILTDSDGGVSDTIDGETVQYLDSQYLAIQIVADADDSAWWII